MSIAAHPEVCRGTLSPQNQMLKFHRAEALPVESIALKNTWRKVKMRIAGYFQLVTLGIRASSRVCVYLQR